jgi:hypothetical protein
MKTVLVPLLETLIDILRSWASLHLEMLVMRQQLAMVAKTAQLSPQRAV